MKPKSCFKKISTEETFTDNWQTSWFELNALASMLTVGIDVGGTFTDFVFLDRVTKAVSWRKVPTTPDDPTRAVLAGLADAVPQIERIVHGTTIATNAILQRKGSTVALITTQGIRDQIEIGDTLRYTGGLHDHRWVREKPFMIPNRLRFEVNERISHNGTIETPLKAKDLLPIIKILRDRGIDAIAVCFLNSYANATHELQALNLIKEHLPDAWVSYSALVPEYREYPRFMTAVLNSYVAPILGTYVKRFASRLRDAGFGGEVLYMSSAGGICSEATSIEAPIRIVGSGVAGGASATAALSHQLETGDLINFEMGGTSTDVCIVKDHRPTVSTSKVIIAFPIIIPEVDVTSIGAGGGSIAWIDQDGSLKVGPQSAGADPGPACYDRGGNAFTVTDANLLLGRIGPHSLLGGDMSLRADLAAKAGQNVLARTDLRSMSQLAEGVIEIATTHMYGAIRELTIERGDNPSDFRLIASGGAGPLHAIPVAELLGIHTIVVPAGPGTFSAMGMLLSDLRHDFVRTYVTPLDAANLSTISVLYKQMETEALAALEKDGVSEHQILLDYSMDVRYQEQSFVEQVEVFGSTVRKDEIAERFTSIYEKRYGYHRNRTMIEVVSLRLAATGHTEKPDFRTNDTTKNGGSLKGTRAVRFSGDIKECDIYDRSTLTAGSVIEGPAIIEEYASTTALHPRWCATIDTIGNIILEPK